MYKARACVVMARQDQLGQARVRVRRLVVGYDCPVSLVDKLALGRVSGWRDRLCDPCRCFLDPLGSRCRRVVRTDMHDARMACGTPGLAVGRGRGGVERSVGACASGLLLSTEGRPTHRPVRSVRSDAHPATAAADAADEAAPSESLCTKPGSAASHGSHSTLLCDSTTE